MTSLLRQLQSAAKGLLYPSEQDHPLSAFVWPQSDMGTGALDTAAVKKQIHVAANAPVQMQPAEEFFAPITTPQAWHSEEEKKQVQQAQALVALLQQQLSDIKVYRFGGTDKKVIVVGKTAQGDYAGLTTLVVET